MGLIIVIAVVVAVIVVAVLITRSRRSDDGVAGFRREIDALSSDARRPTIDRRVADDADSSESTPPDGESEARGDGPGAVPGEPGAGGGGPGAVPGEPGAGGGGPSAGPDTVEGEPDGT